MNNKKMLILFFMIIFGKNVFSSEKPPIISPQDLKSLRQEADESSERTFDRTFQSFQDLRIADHCLQQRTGFCALLSARLNSSNRAMNPVGDLRPLIENISRGMHPQLSDKEIDECMARIRGMHN